MKTKVSVSIPSDPLEERQRSSADVEIAQPDLRDLAAARRRAAAKLERDTLAYYTSRAAEQAAEDEALSRASLRAAKKRKID